MEEEIKKLSQIYGLSEAQFDAYYKKAILVLKLGKKASSKKTLSIVGGQSGSGKSRLIPIANKRKALIPINIQIRDFYMGFFETPGCVLTCQLKYFNFI